MSKSVLIRGGCDLLLFSRKMKTKADTEFNWTAQGKTFRLDHSDFILSEYHEGLDPVPFLRERSFKTKMFTGNYDVVILGCLIDYGQQTYRHKATGHKFAAFGKSTDLTRFDEAPKVVADRVKAKFGIDDKWLEWFKENFESLGGHTEESFRSNMLEIRKRLPVKTKLVLVNGSEVAGPFGNMSKETEPNAHITHKKMNLIVSELASTVAGIEMCDVRKYARQRTDHTDNIRHYKRNVHIGMAKDLDRLCA